MADAAFENRTAFLLNILRLFGLTKPPNSPNPADLETWTLFKATEAPRPRLWGGISLWGGGTRVLFQKTSGQLKGRCGRTKPTAMNQGRIRPPILYSWGVASLPFTAPIRRIDNFFRAPALDAATGASSKPLVDLSPAPSAWMLSAACVAVRWSTYFLKSSADAAAAATG